MCIMRYFLQHLEILFKKMISFIKLILKIIFNILKHIFLFYLYCSSPEKYNKTYDEWLEEEKEE